jgi:hypothetical protein
MQSRRNKIGFDDGKEFKRSSRKKFGGRPKGALSDFPYLNFQKSNNISKNQVIEDEIEEETSSEEGEE